MNEAPSNAANVVGAKHERRLVAKKKVAKQTTTSKAVPLPVALRELRASIEAAGGSAAVALALATAEAEIESWRAEIDPPGTQLATDARAVARWARQLSLAAAGPWSDSPVVERVSKRLERARRELVDTRGRDVRLSVMAHEVLSTVASRGYDLDTATDEAMLYLRPLLGEIVDRAALAKAMEIYGDPPRRGQRGTGANARERALAELLGARAASPEALRKAIERDAKRADARKRKT